MRSVTKEYSNGEVTIVWKNELCRHSTHCWKELGEVFKPGKQPWIQPGGASTEQIIAQVHKCPSGALSCYMNKDKTAEKEAK